ncbi:MAG: aspartyl-tRNA(Asn)/glutamyl-tRNA(Gln) amidotransferase subunit B, partial [Cocleimonas sp.]
FEDVAKACGEPKLTANWITGELSSHLNANDLDINESPVNSEMLTGLMKRIADDTISGKIAKQVFEALWQKEGGEEESAADNIIESKGLKQITDSGAIESIIDEIIANNSNQVEQYRGGKEQVFGFFVGQVMKASQGKANPAQVNQLLKDKLKS